MSKAVDWAVRESWAKLATEAAKRAKESAERGEYAGAETAMARVETWLGKAGAMATRWHYRMP